MEHILKSRALLGLDVGTSTVRLVELAKMGLSYRVERYAVESLPAEAAGGASAEAEAAGFALRRAWRRSGSRLRHAAVAIGAANTIVRTERLPAGLAPREREEWIEVFAARHVPQPLEDLAWDFEIFDAGEGDSATVLLVAARRESVERRQAILEVAGLDARIVDCEVFALARAARLGADAPAEAEREVLTVFADFGAASADFGFFRGDRLVYTCHQAFGGQPLVEELMRRQGLGYEEAARVLRRDELPAGYREEVLEPFADEMGAQINRALQFFLASSAGQAEVDRIVLCGGCAAIPGAAERIAALAGKPVRTANPLAGLECGPGVCAREIARDAAALMIACGLALRSFD